LILIMVLKQNYLRVTDAPALLAWAGGRWRLPDYARQNYLNYDSVSSLSK
jgi:hypothetical protein